MSNYCHCKFSFDNARKEPAPQGWQASEVWVCNACNKTHHAVQEKRTVIRGPANATALLNADGRSTGIHYLTWSTPNGQVKTIEYHTYPRTIDMTHPEPLLFSLWELLQSKVAVILDGDKTAGSWFEAKYQARGIAEALAILMKPFLEDADAVVRAAVAYYKDSTYEVPGLGLHLWDPMYNPDGTPRTPVASAAQPKKRTAIKAAPKPKNTMSPADIEFAKQGLDAGMFTLDDLAGMFKVSADEVKAAVS